MDLPIIRLPRPFAIKAGGQYALDLRVPLRDCGLVVVAEDIYNPTGSTSIYDWKLIKDYELIEWVDGEKILKMRVKKEPNWATFILYLPAPKGGGYVELEVNDPYNEIIFYNSVDENPKRKRVSLRAIVSVPYDNDHLYEFNYKMIGEHPMGKHNKKLVLEGRKVIAKYSNPRKWSKFRINIVEIFSRIRPMSDNERISYQDFLDGYKEVE